MAKMDENTAEILAVLLHPMVQLANLRLVEKTQNALLELAAALAWNDFHQLNAPVQRFLDNPVKLRVDFIAAIVKIMQIKF